MKKIRIKFNAPLVLWLIAICVIATLIGELTKGASSTLFFMTYHSPLTSPMTWIRAFTHIFGHEGWSHCLGNMTYLLLLGPLLEEKYSTANLAKVVAVTAFATSLVNYIFFPDSGLMGASGVVFAFMLLASFTKFKKGEIPVTFILVAVFFIGREIWDGITATDNISNISHVIGGMVGALFGYKLNKR